MAKRWIFCIVVLVLITSGFNIRAIAGCKSDCQDQYESEIQSCNEQYDEPDDDEMLRTCVEDAKNEYQSCVDECDN
jgi:hypothetical protein